MAKKLLMGLLVVFPVLLAVAVYPFLPDIIVTHIDGGGADGWGPKWTMLVLAAVLALANVGMIAATRYSRRPPSKQQYLVVNGPIPPAMCAGLIGIIDIVFAGYAATVLMPFDAADPISSGKLLNVVLTSVVVVLMFVAAAYFLSGKGAKLTSVSGSPRPDGVPTKDDLQLSRTLGAFLLIVGCILAVAGFLT